MRRENAGRLQDERSDCRKASDECRRIQRYPTDEIQVPCDGRDKIISQL